MASTRTDCRHRRAAGRHGGSHRNRRPAKWHIFLSWNAGALDIDPAAYTLLRANGENAFPGWPNSPQVEAEIAAWFDAKTLDEEKTVARRLNKAALDHVVYAPLGFFLQYQAWRKNVTGIVQGPLPFFWGVSKTV